MITSMGKFWTRVKYRYIRSFPRVPKGVLILVAIGVIYSLYTLLQQTDSGDGITDHEAIKGGAKPVKTHMSQPEIDSYLKAMRDTTPSTCISNIHNTLDHLKALGLSIILHYRGSEFYSLKLTLASLVQNTPKELLQEVIVIDDGTNDKSLQQKFDLFLSQDLFENVGIQRYTSAEPQGGIHSRHKGALLSTGNILVFANNEVVFNKGWAEPMLTFLEANPTAIAVPHMDSILEGYRFMEIDSDLVTMPTWTMSVLHYKVKGGIHGNTSAMPVMSGQMFGINQKYYQSLGEYDAELEQDKAADFELSLRTWLFGGKVVKLMCSRVGVWDTLTPVRIVSTKDIKRIARLWYDADYQSIVYSLVNIQSGATFNELEKTQLKTRKFRLEYELYNRFQTFQWYLNNVVKFLKVPSNKWVKFGKLRSAVGKCLKKQRTPKDAIKIVYCNPPIYEPSCIFEYTTDNHIKVDDGCLIADDPQSIRIVLCLVTFGLSKAEWEFNEQGQIKNKGFNMCLDQTGQDKVILSACVQTDRQKWSFIK